MNEDVHIGTIDNKKIYLIWQDVKDICNNEVKIENEQLKELLKRCRNFIINEVPDHCIDDVLLDKIDEVLK